MVNDVELASLLVVWSDSVRRLHGPEKQLFGSPQLLRQHLGRAINALDYGDLQARGLRFVWHSLRHGGASRSFLKGIPLSDILVRGRWACESSGRHYIQVGRQLLAGISLPERASRLAARFAAVGLQAILHPDFVDMIR